VIGIKVNPQELGPFKIYTRTIRFEFFGGEVLDIECSGAVKQYIKPRSVTSLKPVGKSHTATSDTEEWLTPKLYKGASETRDDSQDTFIFSCERCEASFPKSDLGATGMVPTLYGTVRLCVDCAKKWY
jgi:hypothetical protein